MQKAKEKKAKEKKEKVVEGIYLGEQPDNFGRIQKVFKIANGERLYFSKVKSIFQGSSYKVIVADKGSHQIYTRPDSYPNPKLEMTDDECREFEGYKLSAKHIRLNKKKAMELKKPPEAVTQMYGGKNAKS